MKLIKKIELAHNNTVCWQYDGWIYIDSLKYPECFKNYGSNFEIIHEVEDCEENKAILFGVEATGLVFGGRKTICNVVRIKG